MQILYTKMHSYATKRNKCNKCNKRGKENEVYLCKGSMGYDYLVNTAWLEFEATVEEKPEKKIINSINDKMTLRNGRGNIHPLPIIMNHIE